MDLSNGELILQPQGGDREDKKGEGSEEEGMGSDGRFGLVRDRLMVHRISELNLRHAWLAYLSACSTTQYKTERLSQGHPRSTRVLGR
jgi:hypothetical protein